jgi:hypothetical protein
MINNFKNWEMLNEQKGLDVDSKKSKKLARKQNKRKFRKEDYVSDSGSSYSLIRQKDNDETKDTFVLKGKGKDSPVWNEDGKITNDVNDFLNFELFSGENEGKYDKESIEMEKYREGKRRDKVTFTVSLIDQEKVKTEKEAAAKKKEEEETKKKAEEAKKIVIPANEEGENRIEIGQTSPVLPQIKELIRKSFVKKGFKMGSAYGMDWLDSDKLEEKDVVWVKAMRAGFGMKLVDFISQGLVDKIVAQVAEWEKPAEEEKEETETNESRVFNFNSYLKMLEQFDMEAAMKQMQQEAPKEEKPAEKKAAAGGSGGSAPSTGFSQEEGDKFRKWANSTDELKKKYGKPSKYDLDATGKPDNSFIRKAYAAAKTEYEESTKTKEWSRTDADVKLAEQVSKILVALFRDTAWFKEFKGLNDNEAGAIAKFAPWWTKNIQPAIDKLNDKDKNKETLNNLRKNIIIKMEGSTMNDTARWPIFDINNKPKVYQVDTDF